MAKEKQSKITADHFVRAGRRGGQATSARYGHEHYEELGRRGGTAKFQKHGVEAYREMGSLGGRKVAKLVEAAKEQAQAERVASEEHRVDAGALDIPLEATGDQA